MGNKLYVGNLPYDTNEDDLTALFAQAGTVSTVNVMRDRETGRARGFAFVEMATDQDAQNAISQLHELASGPDTDGQWRDRSARSGGAASAGVAASWWWWWSWRRWRRRPTARAALVIPKPNSQVPTPKVLRDGHLGSWCYWVRSSWVRRVRLGTLGPPSGGPELGYPAIGRHSWHSPNGPCGN